MFDNFSQARGYQTSDVELTSEQRDKILRLMDVSMSERLVRANSLMKSTIVLNIGCFAALSIIFRHSSRTFLNVWNSGLQLRDWYLVLAVFLMCLSVRSLFRFCIRPFWDCYFGELPTLRKYILRGKAKIIKGVKSQNLTDWAQDTNIRSALYDEHGAGMAMLKLMLAHDGLLYSSSLARGDFSRRSKRNKRVTGSMVIFYDIESIVDQMESGECLMLTCKPFGKHHEVMLTTSI